MRYLLSRILWMLAGAVAVSYAVGRYLPLPDSNHTDTQIAKLCQHIQDHEQIGSCVITVNHQVLGGLSSTTLDAHITDIHDAKAQFHITGEDIASTVEAMGTLWDDFSGQLDAQLRAG